MNYGLCNLPPLPPTTPFSLCKPVKCQCFQCFSFCAYHWQDTIMGARYLSVLWEYLVHGLSSQILCHWSCWFWHNDHSNGQSIVCNHGDFLLSLIVLVLTQWSLQQSINCVQWRRFSSVTDCVGSDTMINCMLLLCIVSGDLYFFSSTDLSFWTRHTLWLLCALYAFNLFNPPGWSNILLNWLRGLPGCKDWYFSLSGIVLVLTQCS